MASYWSHTIFFRLITSGKVLALIGISAHTFITFIFQVGYPTTCTALPYDLAEGIEMTYCELLAKELLGELSKSECEEMEFGAEP